jgi:hypothetical protein
VTQRWRRQPAPWRRAVVTALVLRLGAAVIAFAAGGLLPGLSPVGVDDVPGAGFAGWDARSAAEQGAGLLGAGLERFDALWYLAIARDGYPSGTATVPHAAAFFPGMPLAVGLFGRLAGGAYPAAANVIALAGTVVALAGLHRLAEAFGWDDDTARRAMLLLAVFPTSFFLVAPYSEALFLAASVWALVAVRRRRWWLAVAAGVVAGLTRNVGVLLVVPLAMEVWAARRGGPDGERTDPEEADAAGAEAERAEAPGPGTGARTGRSRPPAAALLAVASAPLGAALYLAYGWATWGSPAAPLRSQAGWQREFTWPWDTLAAAVRFGTASPGQFASGYHTLDLLVVLPVLLAALWLVRRGPRSLAAYTVVHVVVWLLYPFPSRPLMSVPRFALAAVPVFLAFAAWTRGRGAETAWLAVSSALLGLHLALFVGWYYVF